MKASTALCIWRKEIDKYYNGCSSKMQNDFIRKTQLKLRHITCLNLCDINKHELFYIYFSTRIWHSVTPEVYNFRMFLYTWKKVSCHHIFPKFSNRKMLMLKCFMNCFENDNLIHIIKIFINIIYYCNSLLNRRMNEWNACTKISVGQ